MLKLKAKACLWAWNGGRAQKAPCTQVRSRWVKSQVLGALGRDAAPWELGGAAAG
jgi:hypothetical protein